MAEESRVQKYGKIMEECMAESDRVLQTLPNLDVELETFADILARQGLALFRVATRPEVGQEQVAKMAIEYLTALTEEKHQEEAQRKSSAYPFMSGSGKAFISSLKALKCSHKPLKALAGFYNVYSRTIDKDAADRRLDSFRILGNEARYDYPRGVPGGVYSKTVGPLSGVRCPECFKIVDIEQIKSGKILEEEEEEDVVPFEETLEQEAEEQTIKERRKGK